MCRDPSRAEVLYVSYYFLNEKKLAMEPMASRNGSVDRAFSCYGHESYAVRKAHLI